MKEEAVAKTSKKHSGAVIWFTGLSGAGKTTLADALAPKLRAHGKKVEMLDGDVVRTHLSKGLGFSREERDTNIARIAFVAHLLARNGVVRPRRGHQLPSARRATRPARLIGDFVEVHVAPPLDECIKRDVKGLYQKAIAGEIQQFTGDERPLRGAARARAQARHEPGSRSTTAWHRILAKLSELGYLEEGAEAAVSA